MSNFAQDIEEVAVGKIEAIIIGEVPDRGHSKGAESMTSIA